MTTPALGVDVGTVRVGLAGSDETGTIATPLRSVQRVPAAAMIRGVMETVAEREPRCLVVGLPRLLDGSEGESAADARRIAGDLQRATGLPVELWDERFTTAAAERDLIASGMRRAQRRRTIDAVAASLLLQSWLDSRARVEAAR